MFDSDRNTQRLRDLLTSQQLAVLATSSQGQSYASLVAFVVAEDLKNLVFATDRTTRKFANLTQNSQVALLIDSRSNQVADFDDALAVTAVGPAEEVKCHGVDGVPLINMSPSGGTQAIPCQRDASGKL